MCCFSCVWNYLYLILQNKSKRPDTRPLVGAQGGQDKALVSDTGQAQTPDKPEEPQAAAAASSPTTNNNNCSNYNLVTSLLNLTKSPVRNTTVIIKSVHLKRIVFWKIWSMVHI